MSCAAVCPRNLIVPMPYKNEMYVSCASVASPKISAKVCGNGCISCRKCESICHADAIHVINNVAVIDYDKCVSCGLCATACPRQIIRDVLVQESISEFKAKLARSKELHRRELAAAKAEAESKKNAPV